MRNITKIILIGLGFISFRVGAVGDSAAGSSNHAIFAGFGILFRKGFSSG